MVEAQLADHNRASFGTVEVLARCPSLALARKLVKDGHDPDQPYRLFRGDMLCLTYRSLGEAAGLTVVERLDGTVAPKFAKFVPMASELAAEA
jgi:hypothetical protein